MPRHARSVLIASIAALALPGAALADEAAPITPPADPGSTVPTTPPPDTVAPVISVGPRTAIVSGRLYTFNLKLTCPADEVRCTGGMLLRSTKKLKPYRTLPAQFVDAGTRTFDIPGGQTKTVQFRVLGPALAAIFKFGQVTMKPVGSGADEAGNEAQFTGLVTLKGKRPRL